MRRHAEQVPQASSASGAAVRQLSRWATASAIRRLPTPSGPANTRLCGSAWRTSARASRACWARCPLRSRNATRSAVRVGTVGGGLFLARAEQPAPEPAFLLRLVLLLLGLAGLAF